MTQRTRWTLCAAAALFSVPFILPSATPVWMQRASAQPAPQQRLKAAAPTRSAKTPAAPQATTKELPPRVPFTAAEDAVSVIPGVPEARFWADSETDFKNALPSQPGPWLILTSGGEDGAFGAGFLNGLTAAGKRPDYVMVTGVSTGALMAPFAFAGPRYDESLRKAYTEVTAADIFEAGSSTGESFVNSWPLKDLIAKWITPGLLDDIAAAYKSGRRLFVVSYDIDAQRASVWNLGAIAAHGGDEARKLFLSVLLASASIPGAFPPVLVDVEANGKRFAEMHSDGGIGGQFFVAPASLITITSDYRLPATQLDIVVNTGLEHDFQVVERFAPSILGQAVGAAIKVDTRMMLALTYAAAKRSGVGFNVATVPASFNVQSKGPFDAKYMGALFQVGYEQGRSASPFATEPPPYPAAPVPPSSHIEKTGANQ
ncbi:MAG TPA: patatin-like phospholipase family protein [Xanthobacteraceae bacterium]|nr:patatin-like phospholipase family protein [Xanthobacteraceae bacterium]